MKICILGHFAIGDDCRNGQTIKTKIITEEIEKVVGASNVFKIDSSVGIKGLFSLINQIIKYMKECNNIVMLPAHNGLKVFAPLLSFLSRRKKCNIYYIVIGGWLSQYLIEHERVHKALSKFNGIFVETNIMKNNLEKQGFENIYLMPNCKQFNNILEQETKIEDQAPFHICTFSRVMKEKGIEDIVKAIKIINEKDDRILYTLDIYGPIDRKQTCWFDDLKDTFNESISYKGSISPENSVDLISKYFLLVFPTKFYTEGIPGTIIDAYAAGVPVVASKWESYTDIIKEGYTGYSYNFNDIENLIELLTNIAKDPNMINKLKINCINESKKYLTRNIVGNFLKDIGIN